MIDATVNLATAARRTWDVVAVGAGPAGALAARQIALGGAAVLLVDRALFPRWKVCGCCLNGSALSTLDSVRLDHVTRRLKAVPLRCVSLAARGSRVELPLPGGLSLSREAFDAALVETAIAAGAQFLPGTKAVLGPATRACRQVTLIEGHQQVTVPAKLVLAADGLGGKLLHGQADFAAPPAPGSRIGAGLVVATAPDFYKPGVVFMAYAAGGYVGLVSLEDGRLDMAAAFDRDMVRSRGGPGQAAANVLGEVGWPEIHGLAEMPWRGTAPLTRKASRLSCERVLVLGDAAGYVEPFTGEGIAWALAAGVAVAPLALRAADRWEPTLGREWADLYHRVVTARQRTCQALAQALRYPFLARTAIRILTCMPSLAAPVLRRLNAAPAFTRGISS